MIAHAALVPARGVDDVAGGRPANDGEAVAWIDAHLRRARQESVMAILAQSPRAEASHVALAALHTRAAVLLLGDEVPVAWPDPARLHAVTLRSRAIIGTRRGADRSHGVTGAERAGASA